MLEFRGRYELSLDSAAKVKGKKKRWSASCPEGRGTVCLPRQFHALSVACDLFVSKVEGYTPDVELAKRSFSPWLNTSYVRGLWYLFGEAEKEQESSHLVQASVLRAAASCAYAESLPPRILVE